MDSALCRRPTQGALMQRSRVFARSHQQAKSNNKNDKTELLLRRSEFKHSTRNNVQHIKILSSLTNKQVSKIMRTVGPNSILNVIEF